MPRLEALYISPTPANDILITPKLTLLALSNIAGHCRSMRHIALFLDTSAVRLPPHEFSLHSFSSSLRTVDFGLSAAEKPQAVALRLIRVFPHPPPKILCEDGTAFRLQPISDELAARLEKVRKQWKIVWARMKEFRPFVSAIERSTRETDELVRSHELSLRCPNRVSILDSYRKLKRGEG